MAHAIGLSVGAAKLAGVAVGSAAVTRTAVLTRFPHRPPEVGLPSENSDLDERGLIITDFVERVGDSEKIVASDGTSFRAAELLADALSSLLYAVTRGQAPVDPIGITYPIHWRTTAVDALRRELAALPEFDEPRSALLIPDAVAALTSLHDDPGVPSRGIIAVCDFGATGTSITLADAADDFEPIDATVRDSDLSGDVLDQALLTRVIADLAAAGSVDLTDASAIASLSRLRSKCRAAKERLSTRSATSLAIDLPGRHREEFQLTRQDLDDAIDEPLAGFTEILYDTLRRNRIRQHDLVAVASIGGGARIPIVTTALSKLLRVPVITTGHPELTAAIGAGLKGMHASAEEGAVSIAPRGARPPQPSVAARAGGGPASGSGTGAAANGLRELSWSGAAPDSDPIPVREKRRTADPTPPRQFDDDDLPDISDDDVPSPWYRHPFALLATGVSLVLAATAAAAVFVLLRDDSPTPTSTTISTTRTTTTTAFTPPPPEPVRPPTPTTESSVVIPPPAPPPLVTDVEPPPRAPATQAPPTPISPTSPTSSTEAPPAPPTNSQVESPPQAPPSEVSPPPQQPPPEAPPSNSQAPEAAPPQVPPGPAVP